MKDIFNSKLGRSHLTKPKKTILIGTLLLIAHFGTLLALSVIPLPVRMDAGATTSSLTISADSCILYNTAELEETARIFRQQLEAITGYSLSVKRAENSRPNSIFLELALVPEFKAKLQSQAYTLDTTSNYVHIRSIATPGIFYGAVSFVQLLPVPTIESPVTEWSVIPVKIQDAPTFPWRGVMLDVSRYFFNKDYRVAA